MRNCVRCATGVRLGDYRIVLEIDDDKRRVIVVRVKHRKDVYRGR